MSHSGRLGAVASLLAVGLLASCTSASSDPDTPQQPAEPTGSGSVTTGEQDDPAALRCQDPSAPVEALAATAIAPHPGPVQAATLVRAARTSTGTWYVVGIDRAYVRDDGTSSGDASRALALTNAPEGESFIPLADGVTHKPLEVSWDRVSWTGTRLAAGQRALRKAVGCLDAMHDKS